MLLNTHPHPPRPDCDGYMCGHPADVDRQTRRARVALLAAACLVALAVFALARLGPLPAGASEVPTSEAEIAFVEWYTAAPANAAYFEWVVFMQDPANAAWFAWVTAPKVSSHTTVRIPWPWGALRQCEAPDWAGGWQANTGNGFYGGLQFTLSSWRAVGGTGYPHQASVAEQIERGRLLQARQGWGAWPSCSVKIGLR